MYQEQPAWRQNLVCCSGGEHNNFFFPSTQRPKNIKAGHRRLLSPGEARNAQTRLAKDMNQLSFVNHAEGIKRMNLKHGCTEDEALVCCECAGQTERACE
jgi:hypothetical protein